MYRRGLAAGEPVSPREMSAPSEGGEEAVAPRVSPVLAKPTQAEQDEHYATGRAACRSWCEHVDVKLESTMRTWDGKDPK